MFKNSSKNNLDTLPVYSKHVSPEDVKYNTGSTYNIEKDIAAKFSTLAGGDTRQQLASDLFSSIGIAAGGAAGGMGARKYFSKAMDNFDDYLSKRNTKDVLSTIGKAITSKIPGSSMRARAMKVPLYKMSVLLSVLKNMPKNVRYPALTGLGITLGGALTGGITGGIAGHQMFKSSDQ